MATYSKNILSGSTNGRPIAITVAAATGTIIHTSQSSTSSGIVDEVYVWAINTSTSNLQLIIEHGNTSTDDLIYFTVPPQDGPYLVVPGLPLNGGLICRGRATATNTGLKVIGYVNRVAS